MAIITPSVIVSDIRGKIGGSIFQRTASGIIVKSNNKKVNRNSIPQNQLKNLTDSVQNSWFTLSNTDRDTWKRFASFANVLQKNSKQYFINGQQIFIKTNVTRLLYGLTLLTLPEFSKCITLSVSFTASLVGGQLILESSRLIDSLVEFVVCYATVPVRTTINNPGSRYRTMIFTTTTDTEFDITTPYENTFGITPVAGHTIFLKAFAANLYTGLRTQPSVIKQTL